MPTIRSRSALPVPAAARMPRVVIVALVVGLGAAGCTDQPTAPTALPRPSADLVDGAHGSNGNAHFYFLKPLVTPPASFPGTFDPTQAPNVEICQWNTTSSACDANVAAFSTTTGSGSEIVRIEPDNEQYVVNWHTDESNLDATKVYRIRVLVGSYELGHADVDPVSSGSQLKNVNTGEYVALKDGRTLPITFRIEQGAVPTTEIQPLGTTGPHTCALTTGGQAYCWGYNSSGQLGTGSSSEFEATPQAVAGGLTFSAIAGGEYHTCALTGAGAAYCWGNNYDGELGTGTAGRTQATPQAVTGGHVFTAITTSFYHTCALATDGTAYCWGLNQYGQLGTGGTSPSATPVAVPILHFTAPSAGTFHTCGIATDGGTYCWGYNYFGQLGDGTAALLGTSGYSKPTPQPVSSTTAFTSVHAGGLATCALDASGAAWCWGRNSVGDLGRGTFTDLEPTAGAVAGGHQFARLTVGSGHACGLTDGGTAYCWGANSYGQLGTGSATTGSPYGIAVPTAIGGSSFAELAAGEAHTCGILTDGTALCWGRNLVGELGTGSTSLSVPSPTSVSGGHVFQTP